MRFLVGIALRVFQECDVGLRILVQLVHLFLGQLARILSSEIGR